MILAAVLSAWVQFASDGTPHARAVVTQSCPRLTYAGGSTPMRVRAAAAKDFDDVVCDAPLPAGAHAAAVGGFRLPAVPRAPQTIVVLGDSGCRMKDEDQQNCGDPADWPFPKIARSIAAVHPDLLVDIGDYFYRESNCPAAFKDCYNRWGDTSASWFADWFTPGKPLFAAAPLVLARGNHEECKRGGGGWYHYLDPFASPGSCAGTGIDGAPPYAVSFSGLRIVVGDSAADPSDAKPDAARIAFYQDSFRKAQALAVNAPGSVWYVTHRPPFANANETQALLANAWKFSPFTAILAGHVHDFEAINVAGYPPLVINGESGDELDDAGTTANYIKEQQHAGNPIYTIGVPAPYSTKQYGFAVYTAMPSGWDISLRDADGIERRRCTLAKGSVACP